MNAQRISNGPKKAEKRVTLKYISINMFHTDGVKLHIIFRAYSIYYIIYSLYRCSDTVGSSKLECLVCFASSGISFRGS